MKRSYIYKYFLFLATTLYFLLGAPWVWGEPPQVLSHNPPIALYNNFITKEEAQHLIALADARLQRSTVLEHGKSVVDPRRISYTAFLQKSEDYVVQEIEHKVAALVQCPLNKIEALQIVHYKTGGQYEPHHDYFTSPQEVARQGGQRLHTFLIYLNDVAPEDGGATIFPALNIRVQPVVGSALYFKDLTEQGVGNPLTLHGGAPIAKKGAEKWACNVWVRQ